MLPRSRRATRHPRPAGRRAVGALSATAVVAAGLAVVAPSATAASARPTETKTLVFPVMADTYADSLAPTKNFATATTLRLNQDTKYTRVPYLSVDVKGIPADASGTRATLELTTTEGKSLDVSARPVGAFDATKVTWQQRPLPGPALSTVRVAGAGAVASLDVTRAVAGNGRVNLALTATGAVQSSTFFRASEATAAKPVLKVTFQQPVAEDPMLVGAAVKATGGRTTTEQEIAFLAGKGVALEVRRVYDPGFDEDFTRRAAADLGVRATHYSFKPDMAAMAAGTLDADVRRFLGTIPAGHRTVLTIWHEPENDFTTAAQKATYRAGWVRFARLVREAKRPELSTSWVMMGYSWRSASKRQPLDWWPGDGVVDSVGVDVYNEGSLSGARWDSPGRAFAQPFPGDRPYDGGYVDGGILAFVQRHGTALGIAEVGTLENTTGLTAGWTSTPTKEAWIRDAVAYYKSIGAVYVEYFHSGPNRGPWWLDSSPGALSSYAWATSRY